METTDTPILSPLFQALGSRLRAQPSYDVCHSFLSKRFDVVIVGRVVKEWKLNADDISAAGTWLSEVVSFRLVSFFALL